MIYEDDFDCPGKLYIPGKCGPSTEQLMKMPIDGSMQNECRVFDVGTLFKKKKSSGLALVSGTCNIVVDLAFASDDEFSAWGKAVLEAQEMIELVPIDKGNRLKQARDTLKKEYSHECEESQEMSSGFAQWTLPVEKGKRQHIFRLYGNNKRLVNITLTICH